jgi:imidazolonepropionase-like amidohydrolase
LDEAGVSVTLKSDHPVLFAKYLLKQAAVSHAYGLAEESSIRAVTLNAARSIGLGDRIGSLEQGKEADVVVWDRYPLAAGVHADKIFINGQLTDDFQLSPVVVPFQTQVHLPTCVQGPTNVPQLALTGVTVYTFDANNTIISNANILVQNGIITCLSPTCVAGPGFQTYNLQGGIVTPGVIATLSNLLGTREIDQEPASGDGSVRTSDASSVRAFDAIRFRSYKNKKLFSAWAGGVTSIIAPPTSSSLIAGVGTSFNPLGRFMGDVIFNNLTNVVNSDTFLFVNFGNSIKNSADAFTGSISGQIAALKRLFSNNANSPPYSSVISGQLPLVVAVNQADEIAAVIRFKQQFAANSSLIIVGGAEAWTIADLLAQQTPPVAVVLDDFTSIVEGGTFETWNSVSYSAAVLRAAGVPVVLTTLDGSNARHIRWHAASALGEGLSYQDALSSITRTPATLFFGASTTEGTVQVGNAANFVAYSGDPLSFQSTVELVVIKGSVGCKPKQY